MGAILESLAKSGEATNLSDSAATPTEVAAYRRTMAGCLAKATAVPTDQEDADGAVSSELGTSVEESGILLDESTFDAKVRELVTAAGGNYKPPARQKRVDPELIRAVQRLQANAPLLNKAVAHMMRKRAAAGSASGRRSGSASGSRSGSASGEVSTGSISGAASDSAAGDVSKFMAGDQLAGLRFMGRR